MTPADTPLTTDLKATIAALPLLPLIDFIKNAKALPEARRYGVRVLTEAYAAHPLLTKKLSQDPELASLVDNFLREPQVRSASDAKG